MKKYREIVKIPEVVYSYEGLRRVWPGNWIIKNTYGLSVRHESNFIGFYEEVTDGISQ